MTRRHFLSTLITLTMPVIVLASAGAPPVRTPRYRVGQRVSIVGYERYPDPAVRRRNGKIGVVRSIQTLTPPQPGATPRTWTWFAYVVVVEDGFVFNGIPDTNLEVINER